MSEPGASVGSELDEVAIIHLDGDETVEVEYLTDPSRSTTSRSGTSRSSAGRSAAWRPAARVAAGDESGRSQELRVGPLGTLLAALLGTIVLAGPLLWLARDYVSPPAVLSPESLVVITTDTNLEPLHNTTIAKRALISFIGDDVDAVAFTLTNSQDEIVSQRIDGTGPHFDFLTDADDEALALDTRKLANGSYELFVTATTIDDEPIHTAATFRVTNR